MDGAGLAVEEASAAAVNMGRLRGRSVARRALELSMARPAEPRLHACGLVMHAPTLHDKAPAAAALRQKKLTQAPPYFLGLGSSRRKNVAYQVWGRAKLRVLCANRWDMELGQVAVAGREWLVPTPLWPALWSHCFRADFSPAKWSRRRNA